MVDKKDGRPMEIKANEKQSEDEARFGVGAWVMVKPYNELMSVDSNAFEQVLGSINNLAIEEFVEDGVEDLGKYGLEEPSLELIVKDKENTLHLLFGDEYDEGMIYFKTADSDSVYGMKKSGIEFTDIKAFDLIQKFAFIVNIDDVDKVVVEGRGKTHTLTLSRETKKAENEDEEDEVVTTYMANGKEVDEETFKKVYQSIIGITIDSETSKELEENPEIKTTFYLNKGPNREIHVNYVPYDNDFYAVFRSGKAEFIVSKDTVHKMLDKVDQMASD
jgi:hypothetical protein